MKRFAVISLCEGKSIRFIRLDNGDSLDPISIILSLMSGKFGFEMDDDGHPIYTEMKSLGAIDDGIPTVVGFDHEIHYYILFDGDIQRMT